MKHIQILGAGCPKCTQLAENTTAAAQHLGIEYTIEKVTEIDRIIEFGVMMTPALVVDGKVVASGGVPSVDEIAELLSAPSPSTEKGSRP